MSIKQKLESVEKLNNFNIDRVQKKFTGKTTVNWYEGEPKDIVIDVRKEIKNLK